MLTIIFFLDSLLVVQAETLSWNSRPETYFDLGDTDTATVNGVTIVSSGSSAGTFTFAYNELLPAASSNGMTGYVSSFFDATSDSQSATQSVFISFNEPVYNVSFVVGDIDGGTSYDDGTNRFTDVVEFRANSNTLLPTSGTAANSSRVSWNATTGRATAIYNNNLSDSSGNVTITFAGPINNLSIKHIAANAANTSDPTQQAIYVDDISFQRSPRLAIQKTSSGGFGTFNFSVTNGPAGTFTTSVTTTASGTPATGAQNRLGSVNVASTVTETGPTGWLLSSPATCADANAANSGNPASFTAAISASAFTIPATHIRGGAELTCSLTNTKALPVLTIDKTANTAGPVSAGDVITYTYRISNTGNTIVNSINIAEAFNGTGSALTPLNENLSTDAAPSGDSNDTVLNNGVWSQLAPGDVVTFTASYTVVQGDIDQLQ